MWKLPKEEVNYPLWIVAVKCAMRGRASRSVFIQQEYILQLLVEQIPYFKKS